MNPNTFIKFIILAFIVIGAISVILSVVSAEYNDINEIYPDNTYYKDLYEEEVLNSKNNDIVCLQSDITNETPVIELPKMYEHPIYKNGSLVGWIYNETPPVVLEAVPHENVPFYDPATANVPYVPLEALETLEEPLPDKDIEVMKQRGLFRVNETITG